MSVQIPDATLKDSAGSPINEIQPVQAPDPSQEAPRSHRRRTHHSHRQNRLLSLLRDYPEIIWVFLALLGVFLLVERMDIRQSVSRFSTRSLSGILHIFGHLDVTADGVISRLTLSNLLGMILLTGAVVAILYRVRWRLMRTPSLTTIRCPQCDADIHRVHRHALDRLIDIIVPVRRYRCGNSDCQWDGLRVSTVTGRPRSGAGRR